MTENEIGTKVLEAAIGLHRHLGPGLLEIVYEVTLARELSDLLNFGEATLKDGITRCVNGLEDNISSAPQRLSGKMTHLE